MIRKYTGSALLFALVLSTAALAEELPRDARGLPHTVNVNAAIAVGDLDLGTPAGAAEAERRVTRIVREICRPTVIPGPGRGRVDGHCFRQAMANARLQLDQAFAARRDGPGVQTDLAARSANTIEE